MNKNFYLILLLGILVFGSNIWGISIFVLDEAKNAGCAMEMYQRGDLIIPTFNDELRTDKPPLHYFFMMISYSLFGVSPFAARFFSLVSGLLILIILYKNVSRLIDERVAFYTCLVFVSSIQIAVQFHLAVPDPYLIFLILASMFLFYDGYLRGNKIQMKLFYAAIGLAFLTKGLIAVVLPGLIILIFLITRKEFLWSSFIKLDLFWGTLIFIAIAAPWYTAVGMATNGEWLEGFFLKHNVARFTSTMEGHGGFFLSAFVICLLGLLPFSIFLPQSIYHWWKTNEENDLLTLSVIAAFVIPGFFSFSSTILPSYPAPAFPFIAILLGNYLSRGLQIDKWSVGSIISVIIYVLIACAIPIGAYLALQNEKPLQDLSVIAWWLICLPMGTLVSLYFYINKSKKGLILSVGSTWIITTIVIFYIIFPIIDNRNPVVLSQQVLNKQSQVAYYKQFSPAFVMMLHSPIKRLESAEQAYQFLNESKNNFIISEQSYIDEIRQFGSIEVRLNQKDLFENPQTVIISK